MDAPVLRPARQVVKLAAAVFLIQVFVLFLRSWLRIHLTDEGMAPAVAKDLSYLIVPPLLILMLAPFARDAFAGIRARLTPGQLTLRTAALGIALGICIRFMNWGVLIAGVSFRLIANPDPHAVVGPLLRFDCPPAAFVLLNLFVMAMLTPVVEEVINRGGFLEWFRQFGTPFAIVASALLFAAAHRPGAIPCAFVFGIFVGVLYVNSGSLWGPLVAHGTANSLIVLDWFCLKATWNPPAVTDALVGTGILAVALTVSASCLAALLVSKRIIGPAPDDPPASP